METVDTTVPTEELVEAIDELDDTPFAAEAEEVEGEAHFLRVVEGGAAAEEAAAPAEEPELNWTEIAKQAAMQIMQTYQAGDTVEMVLIKTAYCEPFTAAYRSMPEEFFLQAGFPLELRDALPIVDDPNCPGIQMVKGSVLEAQFLQRFYGPVEQGGNGLLPRMQEELRKRNSHVRMTIEWLRSRYLNELAEEVQPRIEVPRGSQLLIAQATPTGRLR